MGAPAARRAFKALVDRSASEFRELCRAVSVLRHLEARTRDAMVCRGEQLSAELLAFAVGAAHRRARFVDAVDVIRTDEMSRLGVCAQDNCQSIVLDLSRNRSKIFCGTTCSNRAAVAAYRARRAR